MIRLDDVRGQIEVSVPALAGRIEGVGAFTPMIERGQVPQVTPAAFVLLGGLAGGAADAGAGIFRQAFAETVTVVIADRVAADRQGAAGFDEITPIVRDVIMAVVGWAPDDAVGVFTLGQAELVGSLNGTVIFEIRFNLDDQLRKA